MIAMNGKVLSVNVRKWEGLDKKTGQKVSRDYRDIRWLSSEGDIGVFTEQLTDKCKKVKDGNEITVGMRKLEEMGGFYRVYGELVAVK